MYVAEITPPADTAFEVFETKLEEDDKKDPERVTLTGFVQRATFRGLKQDENYTIVIRTLVNGKTICQTSEEIEEFKPQPKETLKEDEEKTNNVAMLAPAVGVGMSAGHDSVKMDEVKFEEDVIPSNNIPDDNA